jgi:hypothetical protein
VGSVRVGDAGVLEHHHRPGARALARSGRHRIEVGIELRAEFDAVPTGIDTGRYSTCPRRHVRAERSERTLAHRGSIAVAVYDLQNSAERHRLPPSPEVDRVVAELTKALELLTLPAEYARPLTPASGRGGPVLSGDHTGSHD